MSARAGRARGPEIYRGPTGLPSSGCQDTGWRSSSPTSTTSVVPKLATLVTRGSVSAEATAVVRTGRCIAPGGGAPKARAVAKQTLAARRLRHHSWAGLLSLTLLLAKLLRNAHLHNAHKIPTRLEEPSLRSYQNGLILGFGRKPVCCRAGTRRSAPARQTTTSELVYHQSPWALAASTTLRKPATLAP